MARWRFDRQILAKGLHRPVGKGDVAFSPHTAVGADELRVTLRGASAEMQGKAVLFVEARAIARFLEQSYAVTTGVGEEFLALDRLLDEFSAR
ncbi:MULTISPECIES: SsgA family sporulation/cell division regulator [unclassified Streptomyces]|uniref:SsgA family sporulation/cell division regulator n=1 Tax=unclassified Streptomyces TaxID=2593676 RepID=UPI002E139C96|nr:SsgA family sporulation/cell division regulator [Streptomyces sp. NBC_01207]